MDQTVWRVVTRHAEGHHGVVSREEALALGATERQWERATTTGRLLLLGEGVAALAGSPPTWHRSMRAACLGVPGSLASHRSALALWGLGGVRRGIIEVTTSRWSRRERLAFTVHETVDLARDDRVVIDAVPVTSPVRTLIDAASKVPYERLVEALDEAERRRLLTVADVEVRFLELARRGRPGIRLKRGVLAERTGSVPESDFSRRVQRLLGSAGIAAVVEHEVIRPDGGKASLDLAVPLARLAIELDGRRWHGASRFQGDRTRQNQLVLAGWTVLRFTWRDLVERPDHVVAVVRAALALAA